jgi:hypothetical protein
MNQSKPTHYNVFTVEEFDAPGENGRKAKAWTKIGAAFPHKDGNGLNVELRAFPCDGRLVVLPAQPDDTDPKPSDASRRR